MCGTAHYTNFATCPDCRLKARERKARSVERKAARAITKGAKRVCSGCKGCEPEKGFKTCAPCRERSAEYRQAQRAERDRRWSLPEGGRKPVSMKERMLFLCSKCTTENDPVHEDIGDYGPVTSFWKCRNCGHSWEHVW